MSDPGPDRTFSQRLPDIASSTCSSSATSLSPLLPGSWSRPCALKFIWNDAFISCAMIDGDSSIRDPFMDITSGQHRPSLIVYLDDITILYSVSQIERQSSKAWPLRKLCPQLFLRVRPDPVFDLRGRDVV
jgi:hypothetical protein